MNRRVLVAGVGNIFRSDDGFGVEVVHRLLARRDHVRTGVDLVDVGIRGVHLAYQLLDGYQALVLIDTTRAGGAPGELHLIEHDLAGRPELGEVAIPDAHDMSPDTVLALLGPLAISAGLDRSAGLRRVLVLGCEPASLADGIGLSAPVAAAVDRAVALTTQVVDDLLGMLTRTEVAT